MSLHNASWTVLDGPVSPSRFVTVVGDFQVNQSQANQRVIGIAQPGSDKPPLSDLVSTNYAASDAGDSLTVYGPGEIAPLELGGTVVAGDLIKSDSVGRGVKSAVEGASPQNHGAIAMQGGSSGEIIRVLVWPQAGSLLSTESSTSSSS